MSIRPEERRTAREYDRWLYGASLSRTALRAFTGSLGAYLLNTPVLELPRELGLQAGHRLLDLGCGSGGVAQILAERVGLVHEPVGIDVSRTALRGGRERRGRPRRVALAAAAASRLPFRDESFHLVVAAHLFRQLEDETLYRVLLEVQRVLKPGGILIGWEFAPTSSRRLNRFHQWLLTSRVKTCHLRGFGALAPYALDIGFHHADRKRFRLPFLFPPIPRVVVMFQKARTDTPPPLDESCLAERFSGDAN